MSTGCDFATISWLHSLPLYVWKELAKLAKCILKEAKVPQHLRHVFLFLLNKKGGGVRTIGVFSNFMRIVMRALSPLFRRHDTLHADRGDSAANGAGGAEFASFQASASDEIATKSGRIVIRTFWDMRKFYDSIDPVRLARDCIDEGLPVAPVALAFDLHSLPRYIGFDGAFEGPIGGFHRSIVAGCTSSTTLCRAYLREPLRRAREAESTVEDWQHIDDVCQLAEGAQESDVCRRSLRAGMAFARAAEKKGLTIADKSVLVSNKPALAKYLAREYQEAGYEVQAQPAAEMLGVRTQLHGKRDFKTYKARWARFRARVSRISLLSKVTKRSAKLFRSHVAVGCYGEASIGCSQGQQRQLLQAGAKSSKPREPPKTWSGGRLQITMVAKASSMTFLLSFVLREQIKCVSSMACGRSEKLFPTSLQGGLSAGTAFLHPGLVSDVNARQTTGSINSLLAQPTLLPRSTSLSETWWTIRKPILSNHG